ncbi:MAG: hypothetical protein AAGI23_08035 [Bacteroidota bacterium]
MKPKTRGYIRIAIGVVLIIRSIDRGIDFFATDSAYDIGFFVGIVLVPILGLVMLYQGYKDLEAVKE